MVWIMYGENGSIESDKVDKVVYFICVIESLAERKQLIDWSIFKFVIWSIKFDCVMKKKHSLESSI